MPAAGVIGMAVRDEDVRDGFAFGERSCLESVRELVVQPARGLIVDDMGRPLVANRNAWVVTVDRTMLKKMDDEAQEALLRRVARTVGSTYQDVVARTLLCGEPGSIAGTCWNGSPYQPVPVAEDVPQETAVSILEQSEDFPAVLAESVSVRAYPSPYGINAAHLLGYLSPITEEELDEAEAEADTSVHGASVVGRAGVEKQYDKYLRGEPGYKRVAVDSMGRVLGDSGEVQGRAGDTLVTSIDARVQAVVEQQLESTIKTARQTTDPVTGRKYVADSGAVVVMDVTNGRIVAIGSTGSGRDASVNEQDGLFTLVSSGTSQRRFRLVQEFGTALEQKGQMHLVFQPKVDLISHKVVGLEALVQPWRSPRSPRVAAGGADRSSRWGTTTRSASTAAPRRTTRSPTWARVRRRRSSAPQPRAASRQAATGTSSRAPTTSATPTRTSTSRTRTARSSAPTTPACRRCPDRRA
mgnify:CR=1 FL=1